MEVQIKSVPKSNKTLTVKTINTEDENMKFALIKPIVMPWLSVSRLAQS